MSNPPASDGGLGLRVRPSPEDIVALISPLRNLPNDEKQTHFEMPASPDDDARPPAHAGAIYMHTPAGRI